MAVESRRRAGGCRSLLFLLPASLSPSAPVQYCLSTTNATPALRSQNSDDHMFLAPNELLPPATATFLACRT